jgi:hypothetical protein
MWLSFKDMKANGKGWPKRSVKSEIIWCYRSRNDLTAHKTADSFVTIHGFVRYWWNHEYRVSHKISSHYTVRLPPFDQYCQEIISLCLVFQFCSNLFSFPRHHFLTSQLREMTWFSNFHVSLKIEWVLIDPRPNMFSKWDWILSNIIYTYTELTQLSGMINWALFETICNFRYWTSFDDPLFQSCPYHFLNTLFISQPQKISIVPRCRFNSALYYFQFFQTEPFITG